MKDKVFSEKLGKEIDAVFLNIEKSLGNTLNGVLIRITEKELENLSIREKNYDVVEITDFIRLTDDILLYPKSKLFTFVGKDDSKVHPTNQNAFIMKRYIDLVEVACSTLGENFRSEYEKTTEHPHFRILEGNYNFVDVNQAKYV